MRSPLSHGIRRRPARNEAHLFTYKLEDLDEALERRLTSLLAPVETARLERMAIGRVRREYLATRAIARLTLSLYEERDPRAWAFTANSYGRPALSEQPAEPLHFNLTNTEGLVACIIGAHEEVGVDAEFIDRKSRTIEIADRFFSRDEVRDLLRAKREEQRFTFFRYWTLKEAYIKARGMGLALPLGEFSFSLFSGGPISISFGERIDDEPSAWRFQHYPLSEQHLLSTAVRGDGTDVDISFNEISVPRDWIPLLDRYGI